MAPESNSVSPSPPPSSRPAESSDYIQRPVFDSRVSALRSYLSPQENFFWPLQKLQGYYSEIKLQYKVYEDAAVKKVKDGFMVVHEHPVATFGVAIFSGLLLMRGPRRLLWRQTFGRLQSEEAQLLKVDSGLKEIGESVEKLKKDSKNMLLRASFGEEELHRGRIKIRDAGKEIQRLVKSIYKIESQAADLIDGLRVIPGRNAIKLRAEVASLTSDLRQQRHELDKKILQISEHGVPV
ncbi:hypothetical protein KSP40_PGU009749 [Platanthera guangdongensis]|uniref:Uncharacterized protein n=1 Tax=Platanthera guangdongensis TaxID=2320717 RepID=A0ABR2LWU8_9ASPA